MAAYFGWDYVLRIHMNRYPGQDLSKAEGKASTVGRLSFHSDDEEGQASTIFSLSVGAPMLVMLRSRKKPAPPFDTPAFIQQAADVLKPLKDGILTIGNEEAFNAHGYVMRGAGCQSLTEHTIVPLTHQQRRFERLRSKLSPLQSQRLQDASTSSVRFSLTFRGPSQ